MFLASSAAEGFPRKGQNHCARDCCVSALARLLALLSRPWARALDYVIRSQLGYASMAVVELQQSAAVRRLTALMHRDDDEAEQARQAQLEEERQRAAAAHKAAAEHGVDPKTKRIILGS